MFAAALIALPSTIRTDIKEGSEYTVYLVFQVNHSVVSGLRFIQVTKRAGIKVDKVRRLSPLLRSVE